MFLILTFKTSMNIYHCALIFLLNGQVGYFLKSCVELESFKLPEGQLETDS